MPAIFRVSAAQRLARATALCPATVALLLASALVTNSAHAQPADPMAGAQLIRTAEPDANGFLVLPLPKPGVNADGKPETQGQFQAKILRARNDMLRLLRSELPLDPADQLRIDNYFNGFEFRMLTQTSPEDLEQLPKRRFDLFKLYILQTKHATNHQQLIELTMAMMQQIVMNNFHPLVRYNAMLIIGELNEQEVQRVGANPLLPEPYSAALPFITERIEDPKTPDPIRVAALVGLLRHLEWEPFRGEGKAIPAGTRTSMINALVKLAEMKTPPGKRSAEGHLWLRRRAVEGLGLAGVTTALPNVVTSVETILKDTAEPLPLRCNAAMALGRMNVPAGHKLDAVELSRTLGSLAATAIKTEFDRLDTMDRIEEEHRAVLNSVGGEGGIGGAGQFQPGFGGEGLGGIGGIGGPANFQEDPKNYRREVVRKRLRYQLYCVQTGLGHPLDKKDAPPPETPNRRGAHRVAALPAEKKTAEEVLAAVNKLADLIEKNKTDLFQLKTDLKVEVKTLDAAVAKAAPAPPAAPPDPANPAAAPMPGTPAAPPPVSAEDELLGGAPPAKKQ